MIISRILSGLGNQMFQYAAGKVLAARLDTKHILDISSYRDDHLRKFHLNEFSIEAAITRENQLEKFTRRRSWHYWKNKLAGKKVIVLHDPVWQVQADFFSVQADILILEGYWAWSEYFRGSRKSITSGFALQKHLQPFLDKWNEKVSEQESVAVHVRRGDYVNSTADSKDFGCLDLEYYRRALGYVSGKLNTPVFYIFSDDLDWVTKHWLPVLSGFGNVIPAVADKQDSPALELKKMSACRHQIIANSSFSWWAAWLNEYPHKIVIQPKIWYSNVDWQAVYEKGSLNTDTGWIKL